MRTYIAELKSRLKLLDGPYLRSLADGTMSREDFVETQAQFLFAVVFFSRPMATLAARMPRAEQRLALLDNVHDEHGSGSLAHSHEQTFLTLLERLGLSRAEVDARALWPEVRAFNTALAGLCQLDDPPTALAALGFIEDTFAGISAAIGRAIVARGWLPADQVVHYATHEALDVTHAEGFYAPLDRPYAQNARARYQIEQGLELGGYVFGRLYDDLSAHRARRWRRALTGPHSVADGWWVAVDGASP